MDPAATTNAELRARLQQQEVVAELGQQALETTDLDQLMHDAAVAVAEMLDNDYAKVLELLPGGNDVLLRQGVGWHEGLVGNAHIPTDHDSQAGYTLLSEHPVIVDDLRTETRFTGPDLLTDHNVISGISVIIGSIDDPWGVLGTHTTNHRQFTDHDAHFVKSVANVLASAIENQQTRSKLEKSEQRYRVLVENFPNGAVAIVDHDLRYRIVGGHPIDVEAETASDIEGKPIRDAISDDLADVIIPRYRAALNGETSSFEYELGGAFFQIHIFPVRDDDGAVFAAMGMSQDVTERKRRERRLEEVVERLEESNQRLEQFAYAASHDLQEPLRMVSSYLQLIEDRYNESLDEDGEEFIEFAIDGADRMREMIDGLLTYSRVDTAGDPLEPVELDAVLEDVIDDLQLKIDEHDADITIEPLPRVMGDEGQLRQVFQNLLDNAIEYSGEEPPRVVVSARQEGTEWIVSVRDDGIGIDPEDQQRIFDVFKRLHSRDDHPGTGIGLALCERIIQRHHGDIWAESEPGDGSTFSFTLPTADSYDR